MNDKVKIEANGKVRELSFEHALAVLRNQEKQSKTVFKVVGNHEFINNELIIKPSTRDSEESDKPNKGKKGRKVRKSSKDSDTSV